MAARDVPPGVPTGGARDGLLGDLHELYLKRRGESGRAGADVWYWLRRCRPRCATASRRGPQSASSAGRRGRSHVEEA